MTKASEAIWFFHPADPAELTRREAASMTGHLGIEFTAIGPDWLTGTMPVDQRTVQIHGRLNGGASVALAETIASLAANLTLDPAKQAAVGLEINANHLRPVRSGLVHATAKPEAMGRSTQVWSIRIVDDQQRPVCIARMTLAIIAVDRA
jgi:1,4-dihydroxy-2-naphthoyl-CoA hydrolase